MSNSANYSIVIAESNDEQLVIRDIGPHHLFKSVTNDAENVVATLTSKKQLWEGRRLFYYDSNGSYDELCHEEGQFTGFAPGM